MKRYLLLVPLLIGLSTLGVAQAYFVKGFGPDSCGEVVAALQEREQYFNQDNESASLDKVSGGEIVLAWVLGYLSGSNYERWSGNRYARLGEGFDKESLALWLINWCTQNPLRSIDDAAESLVREIDK